jgi:hypothetical protein
MCDGEPAGTATTNRRHPSIGSISAFTCINFRHNNSNYLKATVSRLNISETMPTVTQSSVREERWCSMTPSERAISHKVLLVEDDDDVSDMMTATSLRSVFIT